MLRWEHVYWFYCCNRHQQNVLGMQAQAIGHPIPDNLSLFNPPLAYSLLASSLSSLFRLLKLNLPGVQNLIFHCTV